MMRAVIIYASCDGHTADISTYVRAYIERHMHTNGVAKASIDTLAVEHCDHETLQQYDFAILGSGVRYGKHLKPMVTFIQHNHALLSSMKTAFFSVNLTARKANKNTPETCNYTKKMFHRLQWQPDCVGVFAGKLNYPHYGMIDKLMIRFVMWINNGPTDTNTIEVFTQWHDVDAFGENIISSMTTTASDN